MRTVLKRHPDSHCDAVTRLEVDVARPQAGALLLSYVVSGSISDLRLPPRSSPSREDELWRHTCFEAFIRPLPGEGYAEFNIAPSTRWQAYRFSGYRAGMSTPQDMGAPEFDVRSAPETFALDVGLNIVPSILRHDAVWRVAISAVIEETNGRMSYWALAHPPGKPDFHHADSFALDLPRASHP